MNYWFHIEYDRKYNSIYNDEIIGFGPNLVCSIPLDTAAKELETSIPAFFIGSDGFSETDIELD